jgi:Copper transport outer membrane protein, MctB
MFDLRYHVASLAAVFFALVIGILVGVALASHGLGNTERKRLERAVDDANARVVRAEDKVGTLTDEGRADSAFVDKAYDAVMTDRLQGKKIAVLFIGSVDGGVLKAINRTLSDAGAAQPLRLRAVTVPLDDGAIQGVLDGRPQLASYAGPDKLGDLGHELADEFVLGGDTPVWDALENHLVEVRNGSMRRPADGVIVVRTAKPQMGGTARFLHGLYAGLADRPIAIVGTEASDWKPSTVQDLRRYKISTVDDVDRPVGRVALALLLSDAPDGAYGTKPTAKDGVLPEIVPVSTPRSGG